MTSQPVSRRVIRASSRTAARVRPRGNGMLANLIKANLDLRVEAPIKQQAPVPRRGGGMLQGLFSQNLSLRGADTNQQKK
jgi:hypothetical protein